MDCQRCGVKVTVFTYSFFNTDRICEECERKEKAHPQYAEARRVELEELLARGNANFEGIGLPADLAPCKTCGSTNGVGDDRVHYSEYCFQ